MAQLIDGKAISTQIKEEVKEKVAALKEQGREKHVNTWGFVRWRMNFRRRPQKKSFWS